MTDVHRNTDCPVRSIRKRTNCMLCSYHAMAGPLPTKLFLIVGLIQQAFVGNGCMTLKSVCDVDFMDKNGSVGHYFKRIVYLPISMSEWEGMSNAKK